MHIKNNLTELDEHFYVIKIEQFVVLFNLS